MNTTKLLPKNKRKEGLYYHNKRKPIVYNEDNYFYNTIYYNYCIYLNKKYESQQNIYQYKRHIIYFLDYLEKNKIYEINKINKDVIFDYLKSYPHYLEKGTIKNSNKCLKNSLRFLYDNDYIDIDLSIFVPSVKVSATSTVPSVLPDEELKKIFKILESETKRNKKIKLILLLAIKYGLRIGDIKNLKFENIDWKNMRINIVLSKTKKESSYPMLPDVYSALVDYIKNSRPESKEKNIIVRDDGTLYGLSFNFHNDLTTLFEKAGINYRNKKRGIHSMRHTLASRLLKENIPLPIISKVLEHSNKATTTIYTKVDENKLKECCLSLKGAKIYD